MISSGYAKVNMSTVVEGAVTLLAGIAERLNEAKEDPAAIEALAAELTAESGKLASAIASVPPAEPPPA